MAVSARPDRIYFTDSDEANALIAQNPLALLIGFALDQQVSVQTAFLGPLKIMIPMVTRPQELDRVYMTGAISRSVGLNTNPSGTAVVSGAMADVQSPIKSLLPKGIAARLTKSPGFNERMMRPPVPVTPARVPLSVLLGTQTLRGQSPDEE